MVKTDQVVVYEVRLHWFLGIFLLLVKIYSCDLDMLLCPSSVLFFSLFSQAIFTFGMFLWIYKSISLKSEIQRRREIVQNVSEYHYKVWNLS